MSEGGPPTWDEVLALLRQLDEGDADEVRLEVPGLLVVMSRSGRGVGAESAPPGVGTHVRQTADEEAAGLAQRPADPQEPEAVTSRSGDGAEADAGLAAIAAPMLGVFYRAPSPEDPPFVEVGDRIEVGDTVATLEIMKLFNSVVADVAGTVRRIVATDGETVQHGEVLLYVEPDA